MYQPTSNPYKFQYLITSISGGEGIKEVYLPEVPADDKILFKKEQKFVRTVMPKYLQDEVKKITVKLNERDKDYDPDYVSPYLTELEVFIDREIDRCINGIFFWNDGDVTYINGPHYKYLNYWQLYFGLPDFRDTDKEIFYFIQFCEEDPDCFGGLLNTIRRYGKSSILGFWIANRTMSNFNHFAGMQGEKEDKIEPFYNTFIKNPFLKLPFFLQPKYNTSTTLSGGLDFRPTTKRGVRQSLFGVDEDCLNSQMDYRTSGESEYDQAVLHSYVMEEAGKTLAANVSERWKFVKPCLKRGIYIRGKAMSGTTVEFMDASDKGGKAYKKLAFESDYNQRGPDGKTISGLYFSFLPGDCALEGFFDAHGRPMREHARRHILNEREAVKKNPKDHADLIRKYPLTVREIFYINTERCEFNAEILQERRNELEAMTVPAYNRFDLYWENNVRFSKVKFRHNPTGGWLKAAWLPTDLEKETNLVDKKTIRGVTKYLPLNDNKFAAGMDPIDHGVVIEARVSSGEDEYVSARRSRPVLIIKRKYDSSIDGPLTQELLEQRAKEKYQYQTGIDIAMMDTRPNDPNVLYERALMICWFFGCSMHVENQKPGVIRYFYANNCEAFIMGKYDPEGKKRNTDDGTPASLMTIQEYTSEIATDVEYFGHTYRFVEVIEDLLLFNPRKTTEYDYAVAKGYLQLAVKMKPKNTPPPITDLNDFFPSYNPYTGEPIFKGRDREEELLYP